MAIRSSKLRVKMMATVAAGAVIATLLPSVPAMALGNNRNVNRSCGTNYVASGRYSGTYAWAQTTKVSGNCTGSLGAALEASDGYQWPRVNGSSSRAYTERTDSAGFGRGLHWGCLDCNVTYS